MEKNEAEEVCSMLSWRDRANIARGLSYWADALTLAENDHLATQEDVDYLFNLAEQFDPTGDEWKKQGVA